MRLSHSPMPGNRDSPLGPLNTGRQQGVASPHTLRVATGTTSTGNDLFEVGCWLGSLHQPSRVSESGPPQGLGFWAAAPPASPSSRGPRYVHELASHSPFGLNFTEDTAFVWPARVNLRA